MMDWKRK